MGLAESLQQLRRDNDALNAYRRALTLATDDPMLCRDAGKLMARVAPSEAIPVLQKALTLKPDLTEVRPLLVRLLLDAGRRDAAQKMSDGCRQRNEVLPEALQKELAR
jgi:Flp pilus assembly protein TadD